MAASWAFLTPWLETLAPLISVYLTASEWSPNREDTALNTAFSIEPRVKWINLGFTKELMTLPRDQYKPRLQRIRHAMEIVGRALQIDPQHVWPLIKVREPPYEEYARQPGPSIDPQLFRSERSLPVFLLRNRACCDWPDECVCTDLDKWLRVLCDLFDCSDDRLNEEYEEYEESVATLATLSARSAATTPTVTSLELSPVRQRSWDTPIDGVTSLERIFQSASQSSMKTHPHTVRFRFLGIRLASWDINELTPDLITRIQALGIQVNVIETPSRAVSDSALTSLQMVSQQDAKNDATAQVSGPVFRLGLRMAHANFLASATPSTCFGDNAALLIAALTLFPSLNIRVRIEDPSLNWPVLRLLCASWPPPHRGTGLRSLDLWLRIGDPFSAQEWIQRAAGTTQRFSTTCPDVCRFLAQLLPRYTVDREVELEAIPVDEDSGELVFHTSGGVAHGSAISQAFGADDKLRDDKGRPQGAALLEIRCNVRICWPGMAIELIALMRASFPQLQSFGLRILSEDTISSPALDAILRAFPMLEALTLRRTSLTSLDVVLAAVRDGLCSRLCVLSLDAGHVGFVPFFAALADPLFPLSNTLMELKIEYVGDKDDVYLDALETMLASNHVLQFLELVLYRTSLETITRVTTVLGKWHGLPLKTRHSDLETYDRCRLALLSVASHFRGSRAVGFLNEDVVERIISFMVPRVVRLIHLWHETSPRPAGLVDLRGPGCGLCLEKVVSHVIPF